MKKILLLLLIGQIVAIAASKFLVEPSGRVTLAWDPPAGGVVPDVYKIYHSTNINTPLSNWVCIATVPGTNLTTTVMVTPGTNFFTATASNFWGESLFSNVARTPGLPSSDGSLTIKRAD